MIQYRATFYADRYPMTYTVEATSWARALRKATELWQKRFKHSRTDQIKVMIVKV